MTDESDFLVVTLDRIHSALASERLSDALSILLDLHPADQAEIFNLLEEAERDLLFSYLDIPATADLLEELEDEEVLEVD